MHWVLVAITMTTSGQPYEFRQVAPFETRAACEYGPEALRNPSTGSAAFSVSDEGGNWVVLFRCMPVTEQGLREELDVQEQAALFLAGKGPSSEPWWRERLRAIGQIGKK